MTRILDIVESEEYYEADCLTQNFFDFVYELITDYKRYDADMRISGLYYRTSQVNVKAMYDAAGFINIGNDCDLRVAIDILSKRTQSQSANESYIKQFDHVFGELADKKNVSEFPTEKYNLLVFKREPRNSYDKNAIQIYFRDVMCGYVPKEHAAILVKNYSTEDIEAAVGVIRKKVGDARVTFDMYLPGPHTERNLSPTTTASPKKYLEMIEEEDEGDFDEDDFDKLTYCDDDDEEPVKKPIKKPIKQEANPWIKKPIEGEYVYEGMTRYLNDVEYMEVYKNGMWEPYDNTWRADGLKLVKWIAASKKWVEVTKEEQDKQLAEAKATIEADKAKKAETKVATTAFVETVTMTPTKPENPVRGMMTMTVNGVELFDGLEWVGVAPLASPTFTGTIVKAQKALPTPLDYTQYTGFLRTVLEYATFAHVR